MQIGVLGGTGPAGSGFAARLASVGYDVVIGSRSKYRAMEVVDRTLERWPDLDLSLIAGDNEMAADADVVVVATPWDAAAATVSDVSAQLQGKVVISMANALAKVAHEFQPLVPPRGSVAASIQAALPRSLISAAMHHVPAKELGALDHPNVLPLRDYLPEGPALVLAWMTGGTLDDIHTTVTHGIRGTDDADARYSEMPRFGIDGLLDNAQIDQVTQHVLAISGQEHDAALAAEGATVFADNCVACHGENGTGDRAQGAPNLTDAVWLYGGDADSIRQSVHDARFGVMPNWAPRLSEDDIRAVSYYVHGLGGGE